MSRMAAVTTFIILASAACWAGDKPLQRYNVLVIQRFTLDAALATKGDFPPDYEQVLQKTLFARLLTDRVFSEVVEGASNNLADAALAVAMEGQVTEFGKGNRAARVAVGYGVGSAKMKLVVTFREVSTGHEILKLEQTGRYAGFGNLTGGSARTAQNESARKVVEGLMKKIKAAR